MQNPALAPLVTACALLASCQHPVKAIEAPAPMVAHHVLRVYSKGVHVYDETSGAPKLLAVVRGDSVERANVSFVVGHFERDPGGKLKRRGEANLTLRALLTRRGFLPRRITATAPWNSGDWRIEEDARHGTNWNFDDVFEAPSVPFLPGISDAHLRAWLTGLCFGVHTDSTTYDAIRRALDARGEVFVGMSAELLSQWNKGCASRKQMRRAGPGGHDWDPSALGVTPALAESPDRAVAHLSAHDPQTAEDLDALVRAMESEHFVEASAIADRVSARMLPNAPGNAALTLQLPGALFAQARMRLAHELVSVGSMRDALEAARDALAAAPWVAEREYPQILDARVEALVRAAGPLEAQDPILARARHHAALALRPSSVAAMEGLQRTQAALRVVLRDAPNTRPLQQAAARAEVAAPPPPRRAPRPVARTASAPPPRSEPPPIAWSYAEVSSTRETAWDVWNTHHAERSATAADLSARAAVLILGIAELSKEVSEEIWPDRKPLSDQQREALLDGLVTFFP